MARILISLLGKGTYDNKEKREYRKTVYRFPHDDYSEENSFFAAVLGKYLQADKMFLLGTNKSMWEEAYRQFALEYGYGTERLYWDLAFKVDGGNGQLTQQDLDAVAEAIDCFLKSIRPSAVGGSRCHMMHYGINERELNENFYSFMKLMDDIEPGDELYLDITHSFRSIPLFMYLMLEFIQLLRKDEQIRIAGIYYGMLDASSEFGYSPVVDLRPFFEISQWTKGVYDFVNYGNVGLIAQLLGNHSIQETMNEISDLVSINHIKGFRQKMDQLAAELDKKQSEDADSPPAFYCIKPQLQQFVKQFQGIPNDPEYQFRLAEWYFANRRYANGYICLAEAILSAVTYWYSKVEKNVTLDNRNARNRIKQVFKELETDGDKMLKEIGKLYLNVKDIRNNIAHAGYLNEKGYKEEIGKIPYFLNQAKRWIFNADAFRALEAVPKKYPYAKLKRRANLGID